MSSFIDLTTLDRWHKEVYLFPTKFIFRSQFIFLVSFSSCTRGGLDQIVRKGSMVLGQDAQGNGGITSL